MMSVAVITGSAGLVGSEAATHFAARGFQVVGIDNDMRRQFFGDDASTRTNRERLEASLGTRYEHHDIDIRDQEAVKRVFTRFQDSIGLVIHAAAQPSHDWAARDPATDFSINATGTLHLLEATRRHCPRAVFIHLSTNKVYGDRPNALPLVEGEVRWEIDQSHRFRDGVDESMPIDDCLHSLFGASKTAADVLAQEYGRYYGLPTTIFRAGCITGPAHSGTELHGFLAYLMKCTATGGGYTVLGHRGKQVRDNLHSADLVTAFDAVLADPGMGAVFNIGGGRASSCSVVEAIRECEAICDRRLTWSYDPEPRRGDHIWWISDNGKFIDRYPEWQPRLQVSGILGEIYSANADRWAPQLQRA